MPQGGPLKEESVLGLTGIKLSYSGTMSNLTARVCSILGSLKELYMPAYINYFINTGSFCSQNKQLVLIVTIFVHIFWLLASMNF